MNQSNNLKMYNNLLAWATVLQCIHLPLFTVPLLSSLSQFNVFSNLLDDNSPITWIFILFFIYGIFLYVFSPLYWGIVIIEVAFLLFFLLKTGEAIQSIKKDKKEYIWLLILFIFNLFAVLFYYKSFWYMTLWV